MHRFHYRGRIGLQQRESGMGKRWESVHRCPQCSHVVNLEEIDLRAIATGIIACPKCDWSGPVSIEIVEEQKPSE
jgi:ribosomal protein L37AE/L43A